MTPDEMEAIVMTFPGVEKGKSYGSPAYLLNGKFFTRLRRDDQSMVIMEVSLDEREMLMEAEPGTFHFTAHYKDSSVRPWRGSVDPCTPARSENFLERRFRKIAKKAAVKD